MLKNLIKTINKNNKISSNKKNWVIKLNKPIKILIISKETFKINNNKLIYFKKN